MKRFTARQSSNPKSKIPDSRKESSQNNNVSRTNPTEQLSEGLTGVYGEARPAHAAIACVERRGHCGGILVSVGLFLVCAISFWPAWAAAEWPRPQLVPLPVHVQGVSNAVVSLDGAWKFTLSPPKEFWLNGSDPSAWPEVSVPGELEMQGFGISRDVEYAYKRLVVIPSEFKGKRIILRFDGVYGYARVWVNGVFEREHYGGFTSWECDISREVTPGEAAWITVGVTDRSDEISYGSNYAKHYIGGILRDVKLVALPSTHATRFEVGTNLDSTYRDAGLEVTAALEVHGARNARMIFQLEDPDNHPVSLRPNSITFSGANTEARLEIPVPAPKKWDAEHPNLYTLEATLEADGVPVERLERKIGFRKIEVRGNKLYVNGQEVKLRGACRHDVHPLRGRSTTPELDEGDALLFRDANLNFVRTSHYPPSETFLQACDRYGVYVEEETAVCFVNAEWNVSHLGSQSDPEFLSRYMSQFSEMIERDRNHPSVLMWSLGNESRWGTNIAAEYAYAKREDPSRPVIFSYPGTVPAGTAGYDIWSEHYPKVDGDLKSAIVPKLNDEYGHVSCYNVETLRRDPGVRDFWGESVRRFWDNCFASEGCLGGAIWGGIDEVFMLPDSPVGYGEWGLVDGWRRLKPEYWLAKMAYSPIHISDAPVANPGPGKPLALPIQNRFDHTNLNELTVNWSAGPDSGRVIPSSLPPHQSGTFEIPARAWRNGEVLNLKFYRPGAILVDEFNLALGKPTPVFPGDVAAGLPRNVPSEGPAPVVTSDANTIRVAGADFALTFSRKTGLITEGIFRGRRILEGGPYLNLGGAVLPDWWLTKLSYKLSNNAAVVTISGRYLAVRGGGEGAIAEFQLSIDGAGLIVTQYTASDLPEDASEVGVSFELSNDVDRLTWQKNSLWSAYPADHIGRPRGVAMKVSDATESYRAQPSQPWAEDSTDFFLFGSKDVGGHGTNDFRSLKANVFYASCVLTGTNLRLRAESDGTMAVRAQVGSGGKVAFSMDNLWGYPDLGWGTLAGPLRIPKSYTNSVRMRFTDNDNVPLTFENLTLDTARRAQHDRPERVTFPALAGARP
jgi:hypothetical protein